jgi:hypothetical protein
MRKRFGVGTPRGLQGRLAAAIAACVALLGAIVDLLIVPGYPEPAEQPATVTPAWWPRAMVAA